MDTESKTILSVDDDRGPRESLRMILKYDYNVLTADRGSSGLEVLENEHVDLLITGIRMPEMSGVEVLQIVRQKYPDLPVLVLTGYGDLATAVECIRLGAFDYIEKPYDPNGIQATIRRALAYGEEKLSSPADGSSPESIEAQQRDLFNFKSFLRNKDNETLAKFCEEHKGNESLAGLLPIIQAQICR